MSLRILQRDGYQLVIAPQVPCWAATNADAAELLTDLAAQGEATIPEWTDILVSRNGLNSKQAREIVGGCAEEAALLWQPPANGQYEGRGRYLRPTHLRELWLHINNRCNFSCRHCLVSSGPNRDDGLPTETVVDLIGQAHELGAVTFLFTGGEPLLREDLPQLLQLVLQQPQAHAVVMTNGSLIDEGFLERVRDLDRERLHFQVSLDGSTPELNDELRSDDAFRRAVRGIRRALAAGIDTTVATVVLQANVDDLPQMAQLLSELGVDSWHLMWQHLRERGASEPRARVQQVAESVLDLAAVARRLEVQIDNLENARALMNGEAGTKRDGTNACWDSLAIYTDGTVYPSASFVGISQLCGGSVLEDSLRDVWLESEVFEKRRRQSAVSLSSPEEDAFLFFHGGGDPEHAYFFGGGRPDAQDPYLPLHRELMLHAADEIVRERLEIIGAREDVPIVYHVMGQDGLGCPVHAGVENESDHRIDFTHSNCVLKQDVVGHSRQLVQDYYGDAAVDTKGEICCPVPLDRRQLDHIPHDILERSYGCGSPVSAAGLAEGETVVDLGSGGGIECFVASRLVGAGGRVIGVDMTPEMLQLAEGARGQVAQNLGYDNVRFVRGYLEHLPLASGFADLATSNCVINLSPEKHKVFSEILRVLKPGGRMVISDIAATGEVPETVKFNPRLKGECIAGALGRDELLRLLTKVGFCDVQLTAELPWRQVEDVEFMADTVIAFKPDGNERPLPYADVAAEAPERDGDSGQRHKVGCTICGAPLQYLQTAIVAECAVCGRELRTRARCAEGHFVCDQCHGGDYLQFLHSYLAQCVETDPVRLFLQMRDSYPFPVHGPEHHALVPAAFLTAYHNVHGYPDRDTIWQAVQTGAELAGGSCAFWGACSAALGLGVAFSTIVEATPFTARRRCDVQRLVSRILESIAEFNAARCCRRESLVSLRIGCEISGEFLPESLTTDRDPTCDQAWANQECIGAACPFHPGAGG